MVVVVVEGGFVSAGGALVDEGVFVGAISAGGVIFGREVVLQRGAMSVEVLFVEVGVITGDGDVALCRVMTLGDVMIEGSDMTEGGVIVGGVTTEGCLMADDLVMMDA